MDIRKPVSCKEAQQDLNYPPQTTPRTASLNHGQPGLLWYRQLLRGPNRTADVLTTISGLGCAA